MKRILFFILIIMTLSPAGAAAVCDTLRIAHVCDPQLGFGKDGFDDDLAAFRRETAIINSMNPDMVLIAGDMVNRMDSASITRFKEAAAEIVPPVLYTPGNHDLPEPVTDENLAHYRAAFGSDFSTADCKGRRIISVNSMLMRGGPGAEVEAHSRKFAAALENAAKDGVPVIILSHVPPFEKDIDEKDEYYNLPKAMRPALLGEVAAAGCKLWLAGHTHKLGHNEYGGVHILNAENTSCNFDGRPRGFRLLTIAPDGAFTWEFVAID